MQADYKLLHFRHNVPEMVPEMVFDGSSLADYMMDHGVGVSIASTYEIKKIVSDFFEEDIE